MKERSSRALKGISPSLVVALLALFAALSGSAIALRGHNSVRADDIKKSKLHEITSNPRRAVDPCPKRRGVLCGQVSINNGQYFGWEYPVGHGEFKRPRYFKDVLGIVHLSGIAEGSPALSSAATGSTMFILPKAYAPAETHEFVLPREQVNSCSGVGCDDLSAVVRVRPNGRVIARAGDFRDSVALDAISYRAK